MPTGIAPTIGGRASPGGFAGATAAVRFAGATASGAPVSGTFVVGDFIIDQSGQVYICVTAGTPGTWACATKSRERIGLASQGVLSDNGPHINYTGATAPTTQHVFGVLLGLHAGDPVTGIVLRNTTAAAGSLPTTARFGIADSTGKILALSGNLNALASWPAGPCQFPLTAPYTVLADGGYFACFVVNGAWGTTQPTPVRGIASGSSQGALSGAVTPSFEWSGQTDLPAVNASLTLASGISVGYYMGFY
jgi:hypothetical protein